MKILSRLRLADTHRFSSFAQAYAESSPSLLQSGIHISSSESRKIGVENRLSWSKPLLSRVLLQDRLRAQYAGFSLHETQELALESLTDSRTFTVVNAHQPVLWGGPFMILVKISATISLARQYQNEFPDLKIIPIYWMGSEDHDWEELGRLRIQSEIFSASGKPEGAFGKSIILSEDVQNLELALGSLEPGPFSEWLKKTALSAFSNGKTWAQATRSWMQELFAHHGLLVLDGDDAEMKAAFWPKFERELREGVGYKNIERGAERMRSAGFTPQIQARDCNLFYLTSGSRIRLEPQGNGTFKAGDRILTLDELKNSPEHISPNVVMRPAYQEFCLPNLAFVGGGAEVAYWHQQKELFDMLEIPFPEIFLRPSVWIPGEKSLKRFGQLPFDWKDYFRSVSELQTLLMNPESVRSLDFSIEEAELSAVFESIRVRLVAIDPSLESGAIAAFSHVHRDLVRMHAKGMRALRSQNEVQNRRLQEIINDAFPNEVLSERESSPFALLSRFGPLFLDEMIALWDTLNPHFYILQPDGEI